MDITLQISFHGVQHSDALDKLIREKARGLERYYDHVSSCRVVLEIDHKQHGRQFAARVELKVPGNTLVAEERHEDPQAALRDAFDAVRRRVEDYARVQRGDVKRHPA